MLSILFKCVLAIFIINTPLSFAEKVNNPLKSFIGILDDVEIEIRVHIDHQYAEIFDRNGHVASYWVSTGHENSPTPMGFMKAHMKLKNHRFKNGQLPPQNVIFFYNNLALTHTIVGNSEYLGCAASNGSIRFTPEALDKIWELTENIPLEKVLIENVKGLPGIKPSSPSPCSVKKTNDQSRENK